MVVGIQTFGDRIVVSDVQESIHFVKYRPAENQLVIFADDTTPKWVTTTCMLDYNTVAIGDKFGNISVVRLGQNVNDNVDDDPTGTKSLWDRGLLSGAAQKAETLSVFHIGETALSLQVKIALLFQWSFFFQFLMMSYSNARVFDEAAPDSPSE